MWRLPIVNLSTLTPLNSMLTNGMRMMPVQGSATRGVHGGIDTAESDLTRGEAVLLLGAFTALAASMLSFTTL